MRGVIDGIGDGRACTLAYGSSIALVMGFDTEAYVGARDRDRGRDRGSIGGSAAAYERVSEPYPRCTGILPSAIPCAFEIAATIHTAIHTRGECNRTSQQKCD